MNLRDGLRQLQGGLEPTALPSQVQLQRAVRAVHERWPDFRPRPAEKDREALAREMLGRVERWDWRGVQVRRVSAGAAAAFDPIRLSDIRYAPLRQFYMAELEASQQSSFVNALFWVYLESFDPSADHTQKFAIALGKRMHDLSSGIRDLLNRVPEILNSDRAAGALARHMAAADDPYHAMKELGLAAPHMPGLTHFAHLHFVNTVSPKLQLGDAQAQLLRWLKPDGVAALQQSASVALNALLRPWVNRSPDPEMQSRLCADIVPAYGDPRVTRSAVWSAVEPELVAVMRRWLSREDMQMFCDVISATQDHHHWPPRREFWLKKFRRGEIDEAWVAFSPAALTYARRMLADRFRQSADRRFASQTYREGKSLLIMRIGNRIVVDGCNNYKTHIFMSSDPRAPKLYRWEYCCDQIRKSSSSSRMHHPIYSWASWVEQNT